MRETAIWLEGLIEIMSSGLDCVLVLLMQFVACVGMPVVAGLCVAALRKEWCRDE